MRARNCHMAHWIHDPRMSKVADPQQDLAWSPTPSSAGGAGTRFMVDPDHSFPRLASRSKEVAKWHNVHDLALTLTGSRAITSTATQKRSPWEARTVRSHKPAGHAYYGPVYASCGL